MKNLRIKTVSVALFFSMFVLGVNAQPQGGRPQQGQGQRPQREQKSPEKIAEILTDKMDQELELTDAQEKKILAINLKAAQEATSKRESMSKGKKGGGKDAERPSREDMAAKMKEAKEAKAALQKSIMQILDDDQKIGYAKMLCKMDQRKGGPRGGQMQQGKPQQGRGQQGGKNQQKSGNEEGRPQRPQRPQPQQAE